jgi:hypothetical protein
MREAGGTAAGRVNCQKGKIKKNRVLFEKLIYNGIFICRRVLETHEKHGFPELFLFI